MKSMLLLALLCFSTSAFATDLNCHGRAEPLEIEKSNQFSSAPNFVVTNNAKDGFVVRHFNDTNTTSSAYSNTKPFTEWKEAGMKVLGHPGLVHIYIHDRYNAMLVEMHSGYDDVPAYTKYVQLVCE